MNNVTVITVIVEQTADINRARLIVPPFFGKATYFVILESSEAEVFGGILYTFRLSHMTGYTLRDSRGQHAKVPGICPSWPG